MNTNACPIYVINLKRTPERKLYMQRQLDAMNLNYSFVDAIDKYDLQSSAYRAEISRLLDIDQVIPTSIRACALSHVKVYNLMIKHNEQVACILEDDAVLSPDFPEILNASLKRHWDILLLASHSRTMRHIIAINPDIKKNIEKFPDIDCSLFSRLRKIKWFRRLLPLAPDLSPISQTRLDWTSIPKLKWCLLMLLSHSKILNDLLFKYLLNFYRLKMEKQLQRKEQKFLNSNPFMSYKNKEKYNYLYIASRVGALPVRNSQQTLYGDYDIATLSEPAVLSTGYLLNLSMANKCRELINYRIKIPVDYIFWLLQRKYDIQLKIVTPPCATTSLTYLRASTLK